MAAWSGGVVHAGAGPAGAGAAGPGAAAGAGGTGMAGGTGSVGESGAPRAGSARPVAAAVRRPGYRPGRACRSTSGISHCWSWQVPPHCRCFGAAAQCRRRISLATAAGADWRPDLNYNPGRGWVAQRQSRRLITARSTVRFCPQPPSFWLHQRSRTPPSGSPRVHGGRSGALGAHRRGGTVAERSLLPRLGPWTWRDPEPPAEGASPAPRGHPRGTLARIHDDSDRIAAAGRREARRYTRSTAGSPLACSPRRRSA